ncbi:MAG: helix-turn-helix transcriptional regulator [bacterium]|nr:helix-turn-helix transcriptional regulator [bacterium]
MRSKKRAPVKAIGSRLLKVREEAGYSRNQMAARIGITANGLGKNETGLNIPCLESLHYLSETRGISMDWLFFNKGPERFSEKSRREKELELEVEKLKRKHEQRERVSALAVKPEVGELLEYMERSPVLYYEIMLYFQKFKGEDKELPEEAAEAAQS